jgi:hypothetical protein
VAPPERRAEVNSSFYLALYLGVGFAANLVGLLPAVVAFAAVIGAFGLLIALTTTAKDGKLAKN